MTALQLCKSKDRVGPRTSVIIHHHDDKPPHPACVRHHQEVAHQSAQERRRRHRKFGRGPDGRRNGTSREELPGWSCLCGTGCTTWRSRPTSPNPKCPSKSSLPNSKNIFETSKTLNLKRHTPKHQNTKFTTQTSNPPARARPGATARRSGSWLLGAFV